MHSYGHRAVLKDKKIVVVDDLIEWAKALEKQDRRVAQTEVGIYNVSTVFLGIDHGYGSKQLWFETMVFGQKSSDLYMDRYTTYEEAEEGHQRVVQLLTEGKLELNE